MLTCGFMRMMRKKISHRNSHHSHEFAVSHRFRGFSLIELMVAITIFTLITSIVVLNQRNFGGSVLITNLAYDVALTVRQAQVYGISVRKVRGVADPIAQFDRRYGIHVALNDGYYILFADADNDLKYDTTVNSATGCLASPPVGHFPECVSLFKIEKGNYIKQFCGDAVCSNSPGTPIDTLEILFHRPEPEPTVRGYKGGSYVNTYGSASITVASPQGTTKSVCVSAAGQISIKASCL